LYENSPFFQKKGGLTRVCLTFEKEKQGREFIAAALDTKESAEQKNLCWRKFQKLAGRA